MVIGKPQGHRTYSQTLGQPKDCQWKVRQIFDFAKFHIR